MEGVGHDVVSALYLRGTSQLFGALARTLKGTLDSVLLKACSMRKANECEQKRIGPHLEVRFDATGPAGNRLRPFQRTGGGACPTGQIRLRGNRERSLDACHGSGVARRAAVHHRSEEHTSELQSLMRISYDV